MTDRLAAIRAAHRRRERAQGRPGSLRPDEVLEIHRRALAQESVAKLAAEFGVSHARVRRCATNRSVAWVPGARDLPVLAP